jgi:hypothetical protein
MTNIDLQIAGLLIAGVSFLLWFAKRRLGRPEVNGTEYFATTWQRVRVRTFDGVLLVVCLACFCLAAVWFIVEYAMDWGVLALILVFAILIEADRRKHGR